MTVKEISKKWGCSCKVVRDRINEGMIPFAEKKGRFWDVPDVDMPPTRHKAKSVINIVNQIKEGASPNLEKVGCSKNEMKTVLIYLCDLGFITRVDFTGEINFELLKQIDILECGKEMTNKYIKDKEIEKSSYFEVEASISPKVRFGISEKIKQNINNNN